MMCVAIRSNGVQKYETSELYISMLWPISLFFGLPTSNKAGFFPNSDQSISILTFDLNGIVVWLSG